VFVNGAPGRARLKCEANEENQMKPDRCVIGSVACLATGVALIVAYCHGTTGANIAYPFSGSTLHIDLTTTGPGVLGGLFFTAVGVLLLALALLAAIVSQISQLFHREDRVESILGRYRGSSFEPDVYPAPIPLPEQKRKG
jgi:hypothetical protein